MALFIKMDTGENVNVEFIEMWRRTDKDEITFSTLDIEMKKTFKSEKVCNGFVQYLEAAWGLTADDEAPEDVNLVYWELIPEKFNLN